MKVAYYIGHLNRGGLESLMLDVCKRHAEMPYQMVCVYRYDGNMSEDFEKTGVQLIHVSKDHGIVQHLWRLRKVLLHEKVDIVHSQSAIGTILLSFALVGTRIKIVTTFHGSLFAKASWWKQKLVYFISRKIICVSEFQKSYYEQQLNLPKENKLQVVYNGIDFSKIDDVKKNKGVRGLEGMGLKLAMVGNFIMGRSQINVVKAILKLKTSGVTDFDFYFVGIKDKNDPERYDQCVRYCKKYQLSNVHFLGSRNDVPEILNSIDGFVYSTECDTFGIAVIEAIAAGLPIVVNDWPVMTEVCNLGRSYSTKTIRFFKTDDIDDCAQKIGELLADMRNNQSSLQKDCAEVSKVAKDKYSIQNHITTIYKIYTSL